MLDRVGSLAGSRVAFSSVAYSALPPSGTYVAGPLSTPAMRAYSYGARLAKRQTSIPVPSLTTWSAASCSSRYAAATSRLAGPASAASGPARAGLRRGRRAGKHDPFD